MRLRPDNRHTSCACRQQSSLYGLAYSPEKDRAEHEVRERVDRDLGGDEPGRGVRDAEAEEAELAEPAYQDERAMNHGLSCEPEVHAAEERDDEPHLAGKKRREWDGKERGGAAHCEGRKDKYAEGVDANRCPERDAQYLVLSHSSIAGMSKWFVSGVLLL